MRNEKEMYPSLLSSIARITLSLIYDLFAVSHFTGATRSPTFNHMQSLVYLLLPIWVRFIAVPRLGRPWVTWTCVNTQLAEAIGLSDLSAFVHSMVIDQRKALQVTAHSRYMLCLLFFFYLPLTGHLTNQQPRNEHLLSSAGVSSFLQRTWFNGESLPEWMLSMGPQFHFHRSATV